MIASMLSAEMPSALVALESLVEPVPQLLSVGSGHTEHPR